MGFEGDWAELRAKLCLLGQSSAGCIELDRGVRWGWTGQGGFDIYFCVLVECYCWGLISGGETGRWAMSPPKSEIFLIFILFPKILSLKLFGEKTRIPSLLY